MNIIDLEDIDKLIDEKVKVKNIEKVIAGIKKESKLKASILTYEYESPSIKS